MIEARPVGRPKAVLKKGTTSWKPASTLDVVNKEDGYRYRWSRKDSENLHSKALEGWETVSGLQADKSKNVATGRIDDSPSLTSINEKKDCILQRIPEELAQERDAYFENVNKRRLSGLTANLKRGLEKEGTNSHGSITVSSRKGTEVIE